MTDAIISVCLGVGLSAACGFRVFVPFLLLSLAALKGYVALSSGFLWLATNPAVIVLSVATLFEVLGYVIPWVDNALDAFATPAAVIAGVMLSAAVMPDLPPLLRWTLAVVAGGGSAGFVQALTVSSRLGSFVVSGGLGNPVVAIIEFVLAIISSLAAIFVPVAFIVVFGVAIAVFWKRAVNVAKSFSKQ